MALAGEGLNRERERVPATVQISSSQEHPLEGMFKYRLLDASSRASPVGTEA